MNYRLTILAVLLSLWSHAAFADAALARTLHLGESAELTFDKLKAASVGNPAVADIAPLTTRHLLVTGKGLGQTTVFAFDRHGRHVYKFTVTAVESDLSPVAAQIQQEIGLPEVTARAVRDTILLEGSIASDLASERAETIAGVYAAKVKNLLTVHDSVKTESGSKTADAEVFATLLNDNLQASGIQAKALDSETLVLSGKYVPLVSPSVTGAGSGSGAAGKRSRKLTDETTEVSNPVPSTPDPLTRLLASLPPDLRVVNLLNFPAHAPQQILVRAKVIDIDCTVDGGNSSPSFGRAIAPGRNSTSAPPS